MTYKNQKYIEAMSLEEKASLLSGANFWNTKSIDRLAIPSIMLTDGPHGLRKQGGKADHLGLNKSIPATCFPTASALANTWSEALLEQVGQAVGAEAAAHQVAALLGPGLNIVRDPLAGRTFEYFSEDPYITGKLAAAMVRGIQQHGIAATPKHFAVNSQEYLRMSIDEVVDERTLREIYLEGFRRTVQEGKPKLLMTSYNKVNGVYASEHPHLLRQVLHGEWGYDGPLVTDWGGNHDRVAGLKVGSTLEMPSSNGLTDKEIMSAVQAGRLDEGVVNEQADTLLSLIFDTTEALKSAPSVNYDEHHELAVEAAAQSAVLLKNDSDVLPLVNGERVALIGDFAATPRYQGAGSSLVNPMKLVSALEAFSTQETVDVVGYEPGFKRTGGKSGALIRKAVNLAEKADVAVVFLGLDEAKESEGIDRESMALPANQLDVVKALLATQKKIIVVIAAGGPVELPFADDVAGIIMGALGGQAGGQAIVDIMCGKRTPSGKLALSYPFTYDDAPTTAYFPGKEKTAEHREGLYVGYRYYETAKVPVRYPFGYGLSYTTFTYSNVSVTDTAVTFSVTNSGVREGAETAQVYVHPPHHDGIFRPAKELKGFAKVTLRPGETKEVTVSFDDHTFAYYNASACEWAVAPGEYGIEIGASVQDIRLEASLMIEGRGSQAVHDASQLASYFSGHVKAVGDGEYEILLGRPLPPAKWDRTAKLRYDDTIAQLQYRHMPARLLYGILKFSRKVLFWLHKPNTANTLVFILNLPFSKLPGFSGGKISEKMIKRLLGLRS